MALGGPVPGRMRPMSNRRVGRIHIPVEDLEIHTWRAGLHRIDTPPIVLVHGLVSGRHMLPLAERLAGDFMVFAPDLPGFGKSHKPSRVLNVSELTDALAAWMDAAGLDRAALLGNSFGCQVIVELAVRHPELVERVVLQGPTMDPAARTVRQQLWRWLRNAPRDPPSHALNLLRDYRDCGMRRLLRTFQYALEDRIEEKLPHVGVPALVVRGSRDPITPQRWAEEAARLLPMGRLAVIPGVAHTVNYAAPLELTRVVRPFLNDSAKSSTERMS